MRDIASRSDPDARSQGRGRGALGRNQQRHRAGLPKRSVHPRAGGRGVRGRRSSTTSGVKHAIGVNSGTDALISRSARSTSARVTRSSPRPSPSSPPRRRSCTSGATPVFVDIREDSFNIDPDLIEAADHRAHEGDIARAPVRESGGHDEDHGVGAEARPQGPGGRRTVVRGDVLRRQRRGCGGTRSFARREDDRSDRGHGSVQLLPDEEPRGVRRRRPPSVRRRRRCCGGSLTTSARRLRRRPVPPRSYRLQFTPGRHSSCHTSGETTAS